MGDVSRLLWSLIDYKVNNNLHIGIVNIFLQKMGFTWCIFIDILYYVIAADSWKSHSSYSFGYLFWNHVYESIHDFFVYTWFLYIFIYILHNGCQRAFLDVFYELV